MDILVRGRARGRSHVSAKIFHVLARGDLVTGRLETRTPLKHLRYIPIKELFSSSFPALHSSLQAYRYICNSEFCFFFFLQIGVEVARASRVSMKKNKGPCYPKGLFTPEGIR